MRVSKKSQTRPSRKSGKAKKPASALGLSTFSNALTTAAREADTNLLVSPHHSAVATDHLQGLLGIQEHKDHEQSKVVQSLEYGNGLLDKLETLRRLLLEGNVSKQDLLALKTLLSQAKSKTGDVRLNGLVREIELRAHVELAKYAKKINVK